ncbi:type II secretion system secretin GspD [Luminiphilus sp.]|nr:type II secretion system secretin GspD [Luminiphilus sp.]
MIIDETNRFRFSRAYPPALCALALVLVSCASPNSAQIVAESTAEGAGNVASVTATRADEEVESGSTRPSTLEPTVFSGTGRFVAAPLPRPPIRLDGDAVLVNFEQAPLAEVVHSILGETLGLDYVIEHPINGEITLRTRSPIPQDQLLPILESLLLNNGVVMIRGPEDRFYVSGSDTARKTVPRFDAEPSAGFSNVIVRLQNINATEMANILEPVAPPEAFVRIDNRRNILILAGTQIQLEGWLDIVSTFDIDQLAGVSVGVFPVRSAAVEEIFLELEQILGNANADGEEGGIASMVRVVPVERLSSILVISPRQHYLSTVGKWIASLDNIERQGSEPQINVYKVRNGNAAQLAGLLSTIYGGSVGTSAGIQRQGVAPGMKQGRAGVTDSMEAGIVLGGAKPGGTSGSVGGQFELEDGVRVVADEYNNSLLVLATPYEYERIEKSLIKLDVVATQVLIEASIIEVTLTDDLEYGLEWAFNNNLGGGDTGSGLLDLGGGLGAQVPGFSYSVSDSASAVKAVVNALAKKSLINVISTPSVMVLDNHTASIHVGDQQPIRSASTVTTGGNVQQSIQYKDTGVKLSVTPSVNDGRLVTLQIDQSITDVGSVDAATGQRSFLERNVSSTVAVRSGESVVLGGLIRDNESKGRSGVPILMDIPVLGSLFSTTSQDNSRTELLIFISPRVVEGENELRDLNLEMRRRMKGLEDFSDLPVKFEGDGA